MKTNFKKETKESSDNLTKYEEGKDTAKDVSPEEFEDFILKCFIILSLIYLILIGLNLCNGLNFPK